MSASASSTSSTRSSTAPPRISMGWDETLPTTTRYACSFGPRSDDQSPGRRDVMLSRRGFFEKATLGVAGASAALCAPGVVQAQPELSKDIAGYQGQPKGSQRCELCKKFKPPGACTLVTGSVNPQGWCRFFSVTG